MRQVPDMETLRRQRFDIMVHGGQPYEAWASMTSWQREDFIERLAQKFREEKAEYDAALRKAKSGGRG